MNIDQEFQAVMQQNKANYYQMGLEDRAAGIDRTEYVRAELDRRLSPPEGLEVACGLIVTLLMGCYTAGLKGSATV